MSAVRWARAGLVIPAWVAIAVLVVPLLALLLKADWAGIPAHLANPTVVPALRLSLLTTSSTLVICALIGTPLAWLLAPVDAPRDSGAVGHREGDRGQRLSGVTM